MQGIFVTPNLPPPAVLVCLLDTPDNPVKVDTRIGNVYPLDYPWKGRGIVCFWVYYVNNNTQCKQQQRLDSLIPQSEKSNGE